VDTSLDVGPRSGWCGVFTEALRLKPDIGKTWAAGTDSNDERSVYYFSWGKKLEVWALEPNYTRSSGPYIIRVTSPWSKQTVPHPGVACIPSVPHKQNHETFHTCEVVQSPMQTRKHYLEALKLSPRLVNIQYLPHPLPPTWRYSKIALVMYPRFLHKRRTNWAGNGYRGVRFGL
jgi:hypothetical protein